MPTLTTRIQEILKHTVVYGFGSVVQLVLSFILIPLYTKCFDTQTFGIFSLISLFGLLCGSFFYLGASSALSRSYFFYDNPSDRVKVVGNSLVLTFFGAIIQVVLGFAFKTELSLLFFGDPSYSWSIFFGLTASAVAFTNTLMFVVLRLERRSILTIILNAFSFCFSALLIYVLLVKYEMGLVSPFLGTLITQCILLIVQVFVNRRFLTLSIMRKDMLFQLRFGVLQVILGFSFYSLDWLDRFAINKYCSTSDVGIYSLGLRFGTLIQVFISMPFSQIWSPMRMEYRNESTMSTLTRLVVTYYFLVGTAFILTISLFSKEIITFFAQRSEYVISYQIVPVLSLGYLIYGLMGIVDVGLWLENKIQYQAYVFLGIVAVKFGLNYMLIHAFGYVGAAVSVLLCFLLMVTAIYLISDRYFHISLEMKRIGLIVSSYIVVIAAYYFFQDAPINRVWVRISLLLAVLGYFYIVVLERNEKEKVLLLLGKLYHYTRVSLNFK